MNAKQSILTCFAQSDMIVSSYLGDLKSEDLLVRAIPGTNHIAWQLGHLISSERWLIDKALPGAVEALPADFEAKHKKEAATNDAPSDFLTKEEYLSWAKKVRANVLAILDSLSDADLDKPVSGMPPVVKTVGDMFLFASGHWMMHVGQWAIVRRKLGRPPLF